MELTPRERVLTALLGKGEPDRVPWLEHDVQINFQLKVMGRSNFTPAELAARLGLDGFGFSYPSGVSFDFYPPLMVKKESFNGLEMVGQGLLTGTERLKDLTLPDPDRPEIYQQVREWLNAYKGDYAVFARIRLGIAPTYLGMGLERFSYNLVDNPDFIHELAETLGVWKEKNMYGKKTMGIERSTFLINPDNQIVKEWRKVKVSGHAQEVLAKVKEIVKS